MVWFLAAGFMCTHDFWTAVFWDIEDKSNSMRKTDFWDVGTGH